MLDGFTLIESIDGNEKVDNINVPFKVTCLMFPTTKNLMDYKIYKQLDMQLKGLMIK